MASLRLLRCIAQHLAKLRFLSAGINFTKISSEMFDRRQPLKQLHLTPWPAVNDCSCSSADLP